MAPPSVDDARFCEGSSAQQAIPDNFQSGRFCVPGRSREEHTMKRLSSLLLACQYALSCAPAHGQQQVVVARPDADGVQRIRIIGGEYFFEPQRVVVKANVPVELSLSKEASAVPHSFVIDAPQAGMVVDEMLDVEIKRIRFTPTAPGIYPYYCRNRLLFFKSHRDKGMEGMLEVEP
jgi:heme/copper-type cytochrome/quinol oxidase subunit 2